MQPLLRVSVLERQVVSGFVDHLLVSGVVEVSTDRRGANVVMTRKKELKWRFYLDFREINAARLHPHERWRCRRDYDVMTQLQGPTFFSSCDLAAGFAQVPVDPEDWRLLQLTVNLQLTVLPMGICSSPRICASRRT
jgi:hypothetical protein